MNVRKKPATKPLESSTREIEEKETNLLYGTQCLRNGCLEQGCAAYANAGVKVPPELFIVCGDACTSLQRYEDAFHAFKSAHAVQHLEALGDLLAENKIYGNAYRAYVEAGATKKLVTLGRTLLLSGDLRRGTEAYHAAGNAPPPDELTTCGKACLDKGDSAEAELAFIAAGAAKHLIALGDTYSGMRKYADAIRIYSAAKADAKLLALGEHCIRGGWHENALDAYRAAVRLGVRA